MPLLLPLCYVRTSASVGWPNSDLGYIPKCIEDSLQPSNRKNLVLDLLLSGRDVW